MRHGVDKVLMDGQLIGWLARKSGARFCPIVKLDELTAKDVVGELRKIRAESGMPVGTKPGAGIPSDAAMREVMDEATEEDDD